MTRRRPEQYDDGLGAARRRGAWRHFAGDRTACAKPARTQPTPMDEILARAVRPGSGTSMVPPATLPVMGKGRRTRSPDAWLRTWLGFTRRECHEALPDDLERLPLFAPPLSRDEWHGAACAADFLCVYGWSEPDQQRWIDTMTALPPLARAGILRMLAKSGKAIRSGRATPDAVLQVAVGARELADVAPEACRWLDGAAILWIRQLGERRERQAAAVELHVLQETARRSTGCVLAVPQADGRGRCDVAEVYRNGHWRLSAVVEVKSWLHNAGRFGDGKFRKALLHMARNGGRQLRETVEDCGNPPENGSRFTCFLWSRYEQMVQAAMARLLDPRPPRRDDATVQMARLLGRVQQLVGAAVAGGQVAIGFLGDQGLPSKRPMLLVPVLD